MQSPIQIRTQFIIAHVIFLSPHYFMEIISHIRQ